MGYSKMVKVDTGKIEAILVSRGMKKKDMSIAMCHDYTFISGVCRRGTMARPDVLLFKSLYGVDILLEEDEPTSIDKPSSLDYNKLGAVAKQVIDYDKLAQALSNVIDYDKLSDAVCRAMVKALEGDKPTTVEKRKLE